MHMEDWRKNLKKRPTRTWSRVEIEEIIKENHIDRARFAEYSKTEYQAIINRFYYAFVNYNSTSTVKVQGAWNNIRHSLSKADFISEDIGWYEMLDTMRRSLAMRCDAKCFLLLEDGWLYEGYIEEVNNVLREIDGFIEAFYIFTYDFDFLYVYSSDARGYVLYN